MIVLCESFQQRLDRAWSRLQSVELTRAGGHCSQIDLDQHCVELIEDLVDKREAKVGPMRKAGSKLGPNTMPLG